MLLHKNTALLQSKNEFSRLLQYMLQMLHSINSISAVFLTETERKTFNLQGPKPSQPYHWTLHLFLICYWCLQPHTNWHGIHSVEVWTLIKLSTVKSGRTLNHFIMSPLQEHDILSLILAQTLFDLENSKSYTAAARLEQNVIFCWIFMWMPNIKISTMGFIIIRLPDGSLSHCVLWDFAADMLKIFSWKTCFKCSAVKEFRTLWLSTNITSVWWITGALCVKAK